MDIINALGGIFENITEYLLPHAAFLGVTLILLIVGHRMSSRVFTKARAYRFYGRSAEGRWKWRFFYWGRETLPLHAIAAGIVIGLFWNDPEGRGWNRAASVAYFAAAGAASMALWSVMKAWTKKKGITLQLPGESEPPDREMPEKGVWVDGMRRTDLEAAEEEGEGSEPNAAPTRLSMPLQSWNAAREHVPDTTVDLEDELSFDEVTPAAVPSKKKLPLVSPKTRNVLEGIKPTTPKPGKK